MCFDALPRCAVIQIPVSRWTTARCRGAIEVMKRWSSYTVHETASLPPCWYALACFTDDGSVTTTVNFYRGL